MKNPGIACVSRRWAIGLLLGFLAVAGACSEYELVRPDHTDVFFQMPPTSVDILLVVDNSCSMADEQEKLSTGFDDFVSAFEFADVDYHIGVVTTDTDNPNQAGRLQGNPKWIQPDTEAGAEAFKAAVQVGTVGSGYERGLEAARSALGPEMAAGYNVGFLREDAYLSLIFVSDEEDFSTEPVANYINFFWAQKTGQGRDALTASSLVGSDDAGEPADCGDQSSPYVGASAAHRYVDVARQTNGIIGSICSDDFSPIIGELGLNSSRLTDRFELSRAPDVDSMEVEITPEGEDEAFPVESDHEDYPWEVQVIEGAQGDEYWLVFVDNFPPVNAQIVVRYDLGGAEDTFDDDDDTSGEE
jgi:hypothetical protein